MKRTFSDMQTGLSTLTTFDSNDSRSLKHTLDGTIRLRVVKALDISKPADKPIDEIEEPEEEEVARENKLNKSNARMIQLDLRDVNDTCIKAVETERIEMLNDVIQDHIVTIRGPVDVRCGNIMLEKKHLISVEQGPKSEQKQEPKEKKPEIPVIDCAEDWDEEEEDDCIILD